MGATFEEEYKDKLLWHVASISPSKVTSSNKSTCASWILYFVKTREPYLASFGGVVILLVVQFICLECQRMD